jgi:hypothetical protein
VPANRGRRRLPLLTRMRAKTAFKGAAVGAVLTGVAVWAARAILVRRLTEGDSESNEFSVAAIVGGVDRASTASALRRGRVVAAVGGVNLDLRGATLDPAGADLRVEAYVGGVQVSVPNTWRVPVQWEAAMGGVEANVPKPDDLPEDAPTLRIDAIARVGGVMVVAEGEG